jgi:drug/metabolite transporter (DMT)-like permease
LNAVQLATVGLGCLIPGFFFGGYHFTARAWAAAVFTGIAVSGIGLGMQLWGQANVPPSRAALILTLEPVFAALFGYVAGERLGAIALVGAGLIMAGVLLSELGPWPRTLQPEAPS